VLSIVTAIQTFIAEWTPSIKVRVMLATVILVGCGMVALNASADFIGHFIGLILALLLVLVPWASINLIDFYLIKKGQYDIASIFSADGGIYGRFNHHAIIAYACGIVVQLPFANTALYVGPYSNIVEGADLSWLFGLIVTVPLYYCLATRGKAAEQAGRVVSIND